MNNVLKFQIPVTYQNDKINRADPDQKDQFLFGLQLFHV